MVSFRSDGTKSNDDDECGAAAVYYSSYGSIYMNQRKITHNLLSYQHHYQYLSSLYRFS